MSIVKLRDLIEGESLLCGHRFEDTASRGLTDTALSCRPPVKVPSPGRRPPDESTPEPGGRQLESPAGSEVAAGQLQCLVRPRVRIGKRKSRCDGRPRAPLRTKSESAETQPAPSGERSGEDTRLGNKTERIAKGIGGIE